MPRTTCEGAGSSTKLWMVRSSWLTTTSVAVIAYFVRSGGGAVPPGLTLEMIDTMPMTPTGKISKAELLEMVAAR